MILFKRSLDIGGSYGITTLDLGMAGGSGSLTRLAGGTRSFIEGLKSICEHAINAFIEDNDLMELKRKPEPPYIYRRYSVKGKGSSWGVYENDVNIFSLSKREFADNTVSSIERCVYQFRQDNNLLTRSETRILARGEEEYISAWVKAQKRGLSVSPQYQISDRRGHVVYTRDTVEERVFLAKYGRYKNRELPLAHLERRLSEWDSPIHPDWISRSEFSSLPRSKRARAMIAIMDDVITMVDARSAYDFDGWDIFLSNYREFRGDVLKNKDKGSSRKLDEYRDLWALKDEDSEKKMKIMLFVALNGVSDVAFAPTTDRRQKRPEPQIVEIAVSLYEQLGLDSQEIYGVKSSLSRALNIAEKAIS